MDNISFHASERIECMCLEARVKLVYLLPYSPDLNPIEGFFAELKAFIKRTGSCLKMTQMEILNNFWSGA